MFTDLDKKWPVVTMVFISVITCKDMLSEKWSFVFGKRLLIAQPSCNHIKPFKLLISSCHLCTLRPFKKTFVKIIFANTTILCLEGVRLRGSDEKI